MNKYTLKLEEVMRYITGNLESTNTLSRFVLETTPFSNGAFFTFLKNDLSEKQLYEFRHGGVGSRKKDLYINLIHQELISSNEGCCFFDCIDQDYNPSSQSNLTDKIEIHYQKELYFAVTQNIVTKELLLECFRESDCIWHSLIVLSNHPFSKKKDQSITSNELEKIARNAKYVLLRAYDMEGYVVWKSNHS